MTCIEGHAGEGTVMGRRTAELSGPAKAPSEHRAELAGSAPASG